MATVEKVKRVDTKILPVCFVKIITLFTSVYPYLSSGPSSVRAFLLTQPACDTTFLDHLLTSSWQYKFYYTQQDMEHFILIWLFIACLLLLEYNPT